jgi:hypothetical protein
VDIRQFRSELAEAFNAAGFERRKIKGASSTIWILPGREVQRAFWEDVIRRPWGCLLSGTLAIDVPAFRSWLQQQFPSQEQGILRSSLFSRHIANEPDMFFGVEHGDPPFDEWVSVIRSRLAVLPDTIQKLRRAVGEQAQGLRLVWDPHASPKAWSYFEAWAHGEEPKHRPPYCLPTGEIVDAAANDPT